MICMPLVTPGKTLGATRALDGELLDELMAGAVTGKQDDADAD